MELPQSLPQLEALCERLYTVQVHGMLGGGVALIW